jgi:hypothetical protein
LSILLNPALDKAKRICFLSGTVRTAASMFLFFVDSTMDIDIGETEKKKTNSNVLDEG